MTDIKINDPKKGEIWHVNFDPSEGQEIGKIRPALVINEPFVGHLGNRIVLPITEWKPSRDRFMWMLKVKKSNMNGLKKDSVIDASQIKSVSVQRFAYKYGEVTTQQLYEALGRVTLCIGFEG